MGKQEVVNQYYVHAKFPDKEVHLSSEDLEFWGGKIPKAIVFVTASLRKARMANEILTLLNSASSQAAQTFQELFAILGLKMEQLDDYRKDIETIQNGNGAIPDGTILPLGYFHGAPVILYAWDREPKENNHPEKIAGKKISDVVAMLSGENDVGVVSSDTVGMVNDGGEWESYGKPENLDRRLFSPPEPLDDDALWYRTHLALFFDRLKRIAHEYIQEHFPEDAQYAHAIGIVAVAINALNPIQLKKKHVLEYKLRQEQILQRVSDINPDAGHGGIPQRILDLILPEYQKLSVFEKYLFLCRILGVPLLPMLELAKQAVIESQAKNIEKNVQPGIIQPESSISVGSGKHPLLIPSNS